MLSPYLAPPALKISAGTPTTHSELKSNTNILITGPFLKSHCVVKALINDHRERLEGHQLLTAKPLMIFLISSILY